MLFMSLFLSTILLAVANVAVAASRFAAGWVVLAGLACTLLPCLWLEVYLPLALQSLLLAVLLLVLLLPRRGRQAYLVASCLATLLAYLPFIVKGVRLDREMQKLRDAHPLESLEERIPKRRGVPAPPKNDLPLDTLENRIAQELGAYDSRSGGLRAIHESYVRGFVETAGVGVGRMPRLQHMDEAFLRPPVDPGPVPQPNYSNPAVPPTGSLRADVPDWPADRIALMHESGVFDFLNSKGFGYVKTRREVAGFQSHRMNTVPEAPAPWRVARIELIGLLVHDRPVAYPSESLPRMNESHKAPTRPPDDFESEGLASLKSGEDNFVRGTDDFVRMLGAIRATKQCLACHDGNRGDLLGAFSYTFRFRRSMK